ncbi:hypothetical protein V6574_23520 [Streptomyces sp. SM1P]
MLVQGALPDTAPQVVQIAREGLRQDVGGASAAGVGGADLGTAAADPGVQGLADDGLAGEPGEGGAFGPVDLGVEALEGGEGRAGGAQGAALLDDRLLDRGERGERSGLRRYGDEVAGRVLVGDQQMQGEQAGGAAAAGRLPSVSARR